MKSVEVGKIFTLSYGMEQDGNSAFSTLHDVSWESM